MTNLPGTPLNEIQDLSEEDKRYLRGQHNWLIRMYFYLENGLNILNQFRNWFLGLAALYVAMKLDMNLRGLGILTSIALPSLVALILMGRYNVHTLSRMKEWLSVRFSTHFGLKSFNYQEEQTALLREIRDMLKDQRQKEIDKTSAEATEKASTYVGNRFGRAISKLADERPASTTDYHIK